MTAFNLVLKSLPALNVKFEEKHVNLMKQTPFWGLLRAYHEGLVKDKYYKKTDVDVLSLINIFGLRLKTFIFGETSFALIEQDVTDVLGLPAGGDDIILTSHERPKGLFMERIFTGKDQLNTSIVEALLKARLAGNIEQDAEDVARLTCLYFCISILFTNSGHSIKWFIIHYFEDFDAIYKYNWAKSKKDWLLKSIKKCADCLSFVTGRTPFLLVKFTKIS